MSVLIQYFEERFIGKTIVGLGLLVFTFLCSCGQRDETQISEIVSTIKIGEEVFYLEGKSPIDPPLQRQVVVVFVKDRSSPLPIEELRKLYMKLSQDKVSWILLEGNWESVYSELTKENGSKIKKEVCDAFSRLRGENAYLFLVWLGKTGKILLKTDLLQHFIDGAVVLISDVWDDKGVELPEIKIPLLILTEEGDRRLEVLVENLCRKSKTLCEVRSFEVPEDTFDSVILGDTPRQIMISWFSTISNISLY